MDLGLSKIKDPQLKANLRESIQKYMNSGDPIKAALKGEGLTLDVIKKQGLPLLRSEALTKHINKIPGASLLVPMVENYVNNKIEDKEVTNTETTSTRSTKVGNSFPPIKPR